MVDDLDLDILRWMYPRGEWSPWGTGAKIGPTEIALHVGLDRTAVWARMLRWRREGFWDGFEAHLNFAIFGVGLLHASIHVSDSAEGCDLMDELEQVEGVLAASLYSGDSATTRNVEGVAVVMVAENPARVARRMRILQRLSPTRNVNGPFGMQGPPCSRVLTPLDWRILAAIVANPNASPSQAARIVGLTLKTFVRHHSALVGDHVVSYAPKVDWSKLGCVTLSFYCRDAGDVDRVHRALEARFPHMIPMRVEGIGDIAPEYDPSRCFGVIVPAHSPHEVLTLVRDLSRLDGVRLVRPELWGPQRQFPRWVNQRIAEHLTTPERVSYSLVPPSSGRKSAGRATRAPAKELELVSP